MWPKPHKDPASPQTEIFYCSKLRSGVSLALGALVFAASAEYFLRPGPVSLVPAALCILLMGLGGYAVFCELRSLLNPKAHALFTGPDGVAIAMAGKPILYPWAEIDKFTVSDTIDYYDASERMSKLRGRHVKIELKDKRRVSMDDTYGWNNPDELVIYLYQRKRRFEKRRS